MSNDEHPGRGDDSLADHFTAQMNAATSRFGLLCDIPITFAAIAVLVVLLVLLHKIVPSATFPMLAPIALLPLIVSFAMHVLLRGARRSVLGWLATLPFPVDNMNAVLSGSGEYFDIHFVDAVPARPAVMERFASVSADAFVVATDEEQKIVSARFGVDDSKLNPLGAAHKRYRRMREVLGGALAPLHAQYPVKLVRFL